MGEKARRDLITHLIEEQHPKTVGELAALIETQGSIDEDAFIEDIKRMAMEGSLKLEKPNLTFRSFLDFLFTINVSLWLWLMILVTGLTAIVASTGTGFLPMDLLRWSFGSVFLLFLPGYSCLQLLFPGERQIRKSERYIFSFPLSLAILILTGLILNYSPSGIRLASILESLGTVTLFFACAAAFRQFQLKKA